MLWNAKNATIQIGDTDMDYLSFGSGEKTLILLPGAGDGFQTAKGMALPFAAIYHAFAKDFRVYAFSRKNKLEQGYTTRDMARDQAFVMRKLGISGAAVMGVSQGGMIAQYLAIDAPELVDKLVLAVTLARPNDTVRGVVDNWLRMAQAEDYRGIMIDTAEKSYTEKKLKSYRLLYPLLGAIGKPKDFSRFIIQAQACTQHDAYAELDKIQCPTLVLGGQCDKIVGAIGSEEIAQRVPNSTLVLYDGLGHGTYEEAKDFNARVLRFCVDNL